MIGEDSDFNLRDHSPKNRISSINIGGSIFSSPTVLKDLIVLGCNDTFVYALDKNGEKRWNFKTGDIILSSPTTYGESVIIGSNDGFVYNIDACGELKWKVNIGSKVYGTAMIAGETIYIGTENGIFWALSLEDGKEIWKINTGDEIYFSSAAANDSIIIGNHSGNLYCLSKEGRVLWKFATSIVYPSFITRPHTVDLKPQAQRPIEFRPTSTLKGYMIEGSINDMGERTNQVYTTAPAYKGKKHAYDFGTGTYK
ncbi:MAG: PQQ-binding-like beta-propeller repeat protein [Candidatus Aenigmarchaeota archaeon]|nr:PQQ-binding-like beta-propeller repeat protein [Candidatus Aenigmarchaeota archaeon]